MNPEIGTHIKKNLYVLEKHEENSFPVSYFNTVEVHSYSEKKSEVREFLESLEGIIYIKEAEGGIFTYDLIIFTENEDYLQFVLKFSERISEDG